MTDEIITAQEAENTQPVQEVQEKPLPEQVTVVDIHFRSNNKVYFFDPGKLTVRAGDHVIIDTARGQEFGYCAAGNHVVSSKEIVPPLRKVLRIATERDERINEENEQKEKKAMEVCQQKIIAHGLEMQLVSAECAFDGSKIIFFFTADGRVDFRELVKNLASVFRTRIELRQIGVRDKAKMVGGLGICGRPFCCKEFLDDFQPVSIKMAKTQNLSLNPTKISGTCGRLMCCLKYEQEAYEDLIKTSPKNESFVDTVDGRGTVIDVNLLRQSVRVRMEDEPDKVGCYKNCDICVLRNGKAKKTDPPIPKDLAPISSKPRPAKKFVELSDEPLPEVTIKGKDMPPVKPEPVWEDEHTEEKAEPAKASGRRNRRRRKKPAGAKPAAEQTQQPQQPQQPKQPKTQQPKPQQSKEGGEKAEGSKRSGNRNRRRRRPGGKPKTEGKAE
ncbi:MAG: stage 0 sporulation family protein [Oscillospiraceae bacterium]|nr:stage 0 sporulation family protein [Oscillospiraceae bacterium]